VEGLVKANLNQTTSIHSGTAHRVQSPLHAHRTNNLSKGVCSLKGPIVNSKSKVHPQPASGIIALTFLHRSSL